MAELTLTQRIDRAVGAVECEKQMSRHAYYHSGGIHWEEFFEMWSQSEKITWGHGFGQWNRAQYFENYVVNQTQANWEAYKDIWEAYPEVIGYLKETKTLPGYRAFIEAAMHLLSSPIIEVAEDGMSAQGLWTTPGLIYSTLNPQKEREGRWMYERYCADFVFEEDKWVYLNLRVCPDCACNMANEPWYKPARPRPQGAGGGNPRHRSAMQVPGPLHNMVSETQVPQDPGSPMPYKTQADIKLYSDVKTLEA